MKRSSLLARQIRKHLNEDLKNNPAVKIFLDAIQGSYTNYEEQLNMLQRAMSISSGELFDANKKLKQEADEQRKVITRLTEATKTLQAIAHKKMIKNNTESKELSGLELANLIEKQAFQISEIEKQRNLILKDLEKSNKELKDYAHVVSHDLKSPLRNINTLINWVKEDTMELSINTSKNLDLIDQNIKKMDNLINGILEYSIIDQKKHIITNVNINDIIQNIIKLSSKQKSIVFNIQESIPEVTGDKLRIQQIFQNLISNALKSLDKKVGIIEIGSVSKNEYNDNDFCLFYVKDNGKGIPEKYYDKIFEIFQSLDDTKKSTGIGLSIVKKIINLYDGEIWVESKEKIGTTFYFTLKK